jgi:hypothetical protein
MPYDAVRARSTGISNNVLFIINFDNYWSSNQLHSTTSKKIFALEFSPTVSAANYEFYNFKGLYNL